MQEVPGFADAFRAVPVPELTPEQTWKFSVSSNPFMKPPRRLFPGDFVREIVERSPWKAPPGHFPEGHRPVGWSGARARQKPMPGGPKPSGKFSKGPGKKGKSSPPASYEEAAQWRDQERLLKEQLTRRRKLPRWKSRRKTLGGGAVGAGEA